MVKNNTNKKTIDMNNMKIRLSTLWIFAVFNYLYADVITLMDVLYRGKIEIGFQITEGFLLGAAILMETAIAMVLLSRYLKYRVNRWTNIIAGIIHTSAVSLSMLAGGKMPALYYIFFGTIEIACTLLIIWFALKWRSNEGQY